jgi:polar amino acid transport system substrate-binding protein
LHRRTAIVTAVALTGLLAGIAPARLLAQPAATSTALHIVGAARPPFISETENGLGSGPAAELVQDLARAIGIDPAVRILPFQRAVMALDQGGTLYPALLRTPQREGRYIWIGEVFTDRAVFLTRRGAPVVSTLEAARRLGRINVMRGSELQSMLQSFGVTDIEPSNSEVDIARLLNAGRIDGWFGPRAVARATWSGLNFDAADLQAGDTFATLPFWITVSNDTPGETVARLRTAYRMMVQDGRYRRIIAPLKALESPS